MNLPHQEPVTIEFHRFLDLVFRSSLRLPTGESLVDRVIYDAITKVPNYELLVHLEPITDEFHKLLRELGFQSGEHLSIESFTSTITCYRLSRADMWLKIRELEETTKKLNDTRRKENVEWSEMARKRLRKALNQLMSVPWDYEEKEAVKMLNWLLTYDSPDTLPMLKMLNILDLKEKILKVGDVMVYLN